MRHSVVGFAFLVVGALACASGRPATQPQVTVRVDPVPASATRRDTMPALPPIAAGQTVVTERVPRRLESLRAENSDLATLLRELATRFGLRYQIDPAVKGSVTTQLRDATLQEALASIVPATYTYQVQDNVLRVAPARVETRIFSLDYVAVSRFGTATTVIQRRLGSSGFGQGGFAGGQQAGGAGGFGGGADVIAAVSVADIWDDIWVSLEGLLFDPVAGQPGSASAAQTPQPSASISGAGPRARSRSAPDGTRLMVNPVAGTITVSALPARLDLANTFIRTFEASIQRQVLIEAKIVEVNLENAFQFGIDWSALGRVGSTSGSVSATTGAALTPTGNVQVTLSGGAGSITAVLKSLSTQGEVRVLSNSQASTLNNQRAMFGVTTSEVVFNVSQIAVGTTPSGAPILQSQITPQQVAVGIVLDVLPQIGADNVVTMNIRPVVTSISARRSLQLPDGTRVDAPVIDTRESDTMARLRAGETIIIGGLMQTRREKVRSGIPVLRSLPLIGRLFTSYNDVERKGELVIFLTPTIISGQPQTGS